MPRTNVGQRKRQNGADISMQTNLNVTGSVRHPSHFGLVREASRDWFRRIGLRFIFLNQSMLPGSAHDEILHLCMTARVSVRPSIRFV
jgi:hypothetical protein